MTGVCSYREDLKMSLGVSGGSDDKRSVYHRKRAQNPLQIGTVLAVFLGLAVTAETAGWREQMLDTGSKALIPSAANGQAIMNLSLGGQRPWGWRI